MLVSGSHVNAVGCGGRLCARITDVVNGLVDRYLDRGRLALAVLVVVVVRPHQLHEPTPDQVSSNGEGWKVGARIGEVLEQRRPL